MLMCIISGIQTDHDSNNDEMFSSLKESTVTQSLATGRESIHSESQSAAVSYQSFSLPQETNTISSFSPAAIDDSDSMKIVDLKGTLFYRCIYICMYSVLDISNWYFLICLMCYLEQFMYVCMYMFRQLCM